MKPPKIRAIAIDFDGVIHSYSKGWHDGTCYGEPVAGARAAIEELFQTHHVFIFSTRDPQTIVNWCHKHWPELDVRVVPPIEPNAPPFFNGPFIGVTSQKLAAIAYIDDRAITFRGDWNEVFKGVFAMSNDGVGTKH